MLPDRFRLPRRRRHLPPRAVKQAYSYPEEMYHPPGVGVIADLQCGGWSTSILTSKGEIWSVGVFDAVNGIPLGHPAPTFRRLLWGHVSDEGYQSSEAIEPIKQFSSGRRHLLGLDDVGNIWYWNRIDKLAKQVEFLTPALIGGKKPTRVVAGWQNSSAFVPGQGIVYWEPPDGDQNPYPAINERTVPQTGYAHKEPDHKDYEIDQEQDQNLSIGEVLVHVVLENYIVYITSTSKVYAFKLNVTERPFQLTSLSPSDGKLLDIQGSFRNFAIFSSLGEVRTCTTSYLDRWFSALQVSSVDDGDQTSQRNPSDLLDPPPLIPALQSNSVISLAFGDYHFHALHSNGLISSYGHEAINCGSFGLGTSDRRIAQLRGLLPPRRFVRRGDTKLSAQGWRSPRSIWFDPKLRDWAAQMRQPVSERDWDKDIGEGGLDEEGWAAVSEWIEQQGKSYLMQRTRTKEKDIEAGKNPESQESDSINLSPYFAVGISAAGWHSGALVLVDHDNTTTTTRIEQPQSSEPTPSTPPTDSSSQSLPPLDFPTLKLPSGKTIEGSKSMNLSEDEIWPLGKPERFWTSADGIPWGT
ncbi:putative regulator of chromosome condensation rcc1 [Phaeomoniella chlamydospora]|uniref:Putative regulator of chromosome condensation rcc1 n=1 Tax=Phaeomoniella chlamydospora TaxID=158046 RepID=A0A0G2EA43_PHACM|nr:putative regulator of chromosome condensation rcc1 [Phaeomoniella chlamydospora]